MGLENAMQKAGVPDGKLVGHKANGCTFKM